MLAVIPTRSGVFPTGADEVAAECGGRVLVVGIADDLDLDLAAGLGHDVRVVDLGAYAPAHWAAAIAPLVEQEPHLVLPGSPDGRDLAPRLAHRLDRALFAGAVEVSPDRVSVSRDGGLMLETVRPSGGFVATLQPGVRGVDPRELSTSPERPTVIRDVPVAVDMTSVEAADPEVVDVLPPDVTTMDLEEAPRILGGGAGLDTHERFDQLTRIATLLGASMGATRVITDRGWVAHERQIGTTGVIVDPELYVAFGISGAVQHTSGLGTPTHIVSVNTDEHCPMMQISDLAVVSDANAVLDELERLLAGSSGG